ncbi:MAG: AEC family transporter [Betaproteobacteria bacterium]|nr:AEC family transporter [Betaproteobacteria bacterium]
MSITLLLVPDFALILLGFAISRLTGFGRDFWSGLEKLVYFVLFPALLFHSIAKNKIDFVAAAPALKLAALVVLIGMACAWLGKFAARGDKVAFASAFQTAFRFNSDMGLAAAARLHGEAGIAAFGIIIGLVVPMCNIASVWALARHGEVPIWKELVQNPLIIATAGGVLYSVSGLPFPEVAQMLISRMGAASIACGLLCVGAALTLSNVRGNAALIGHMTTVKLLLMPAAAWFIAPLLGVTGVYRDMVMLLAALPTATSAYVLAVRMGGKGELVAQAVTVSTLCGMIALPVWLNFAR